MKIFIKAVFVLFFTLGFVSSASTQEGISVFSHLDSRLHFDRVVDAEEKDAKIFEGYMDAHVLTEIFLPGGFFIGTELLLEGEPSGHDHHHGDEHDDHDDGGNNDMDMDEEDHDEHADETDNSFFGNHHLAVETLTLNFERKINNSKVLLYGGKFTPVVNLNSETYPGIYGYRATHEYEMPARLGMGGRLVLGGEGSATGRHFFDFSAFAADTTLFGVEGHGSSERVRRSSGGVSNTGDLSSFAFSISASDFYTLSDNFLADFLEGFSYRLGYAKQAAADKAAEDAEEGVRDESRYTASVRFMRPLTDSVSFQAIGEYMKIDKYEGQAAGDLSQTSAQVGLERGKWLLATGLSFIDKSGFEHDEDNLDGSVFNISLERKIGNSRLGIGYQRLKEHGETTGRIGLSLTATTEWGGGGGHDHSGHNH